MDDAKLSFAKWAKHPFSTEMNLVSWVLFLMLVVTVVVMWRNVLKTVVG